MESDQNTAGQGGFAARPRRTRLSDDEVREAMLAAGERTVASQNGLTVSLEHLSYESIIQEAGIPRTAAYRVWSHKDTYMVDLVCRLAGPSWQGTAAFDDDTKELVLQMVQSAVTSGSLTTADDRRQVLLEVVRQGAKQNYDGIISSPQWRTYVAITATLMSSPASEVRDRVQDAVRAAEMEFVRKMAGLYEQVTALLGLRLKPPFEDWSILAVTGASVVEGLALRHITVSDFVDREWTLADNQSWHLAGIGFLGILDNLVEADPDYDPDKALQIYASQVQDENSSQTDLDPHTET